MRIYVAGPMTGFPQLNFPAFHAAAAELRAQGHHVENPAEINADPAAQWLDCMRADIARLATCDAVYLLPGWQNSRGARIEQSLAAGLGLGLLLASGAVDPAEHEARQRQVIDLSAYEKARFGVFNPDGRFEEIPEGVSPCGWAESHPCGHTARWFGGPRDVESVRAVLGAVLASSGHGYMQLVPAEPAARPPTPITALMLKEDAEAPGAQEAGPAAPQEWVSQRQAAALERNRKALQWTAAGLQAVAKEEDVLRIAEFGEEKTVRVVLDEADSALEDAASALAAEKPTSAPQAPAKATA